MSPTDHLDCIIVGYNDIDFGKFAAVQKEMENRSGAYHEVRSNSVLLSGRRHTYMDLLNMAIAGASGHDPHLNVFQAPQLGPCYLKHFLHKHGQKAEIVNLLQRRKGKAESPAPAFAQGGSDHAEKGRVKPLRDTSRPPGFGAYEISRTGWREIGDGRNIRRSGAPGPSARRRGCGRAMRTGGAALRCRAAAAPVPRPASPMVPTADGAGEPGLQRLLGGEAVGPAGPRRPRGRRRRDCPPP